MLMDGVVLLGGATDGITIGALLPPPTTFLRLPLLTFTTTCTFADDLVVFDFFLITFFFFAGIVTKTSHILFDYLQLIEVAVHVTGANIEKQEVVRLLEYELGNLLDYRLWLKQHFFEHAV